MVQKGNTFAFHVLRLCAAGQEKESISSIFYPMRKKVLGSWHYVWIFTLNYVSIFYPGLYLNFLPDIMSGFCTWQYVRFLYLAVCLVLKG